MVHCLGLAPRQSLHSHGFAWVLGAFGRGSNRRRDSDAQDRQIKKPDPSKRNRARFETARGVAMENLLDGSLRRPSSEVKHFLEVGRSQLDVKKIRLDWVCACPIVS
jgi:hypothetical protein